MLKVVINHKGDKAEEVKLDISSITYYNEYKLKLSITCVKEHGLKNNDTVRVFNKVKDQRYYMEEYVITYVDKYTFLIDAPEDYYLDIAYAVTSDTEYYIDVSGNTKSLHGIDFYLNTSHDYITDRSNVSIKKIIDSFYYSDINDINEKKCGGDYVLYNGFLYKTDSELLEKDIVYTIDDTTAKTTDIKYILNDGEFKNIKDKFMYFYMTVEENNTYTNEKIILGGGSINTTGGCDNLFGVYKIKNGGDVSSNECHGMLLIPVYETGRDNLYKLQWFYDPTSVKETKIAKYILSNLNDIIFYCKDERFFTENYKWIEYTGNTMSSVFTDEIDVEESPKNELWKYEDYIIYNTQRYIGTSDLSFGYYDGNTAIYKLDGNYSIRIPLASDFMTDAPKNDQRVLEDFLERKKEEAINSIIDYERIQFEPMFLSGITASDIYEYIESDNFKKSCENYLNNVTSIKFKIHLRDRRVSGGTTNETIDEKFNTDITKNWNGYLKDTNDDDNQPSEKSDLLWYSGFDDNDVYYQKKKLKKTFLRFSCYDSPYRGSQNLHTYNTMFLDASGLFQKYMLLLNKIDDEDEILVKKDDDDDSLRLDLSFTCSNKYNTDMSSEGFYYYLFPTIVEGSTPTQMYVKIDLNLAKYGISLPLAYYENNTPCLGYDNEDDLFQLNADLYMKIYTMYLPSSKKYVWFFPECFNSSDIEINLWEPKPIDAEYWANKENE